MAGAGVLYVVATPIGNLEDITLRALQVLKEVDLIAAEDTRRTRKLLARYDIHAPVTSYHQHNRTTKGRKLLEVLEKGGRVALVADAGLPGISDPGAELVAQAHSRGIAVRCVPGPSAAVAALAVAGFPAHRFAFEGFLPAGASGRRRRLEQLAHEERTLVFFEAPHRLVETLVALREVFGDRPVAVVRELTKQHEEVVRGTAGEVLEHFTRHPPLGEITLVVAGNPQKGRARSGTVDGPTLAAEVGRLVAAGWKRTEAIREVARARGVSRRQVYAALLVTRENVTEGMAGDGRPAIDR
jgi:16S rRNA (cytidine1402-2'-O)-methyltransferase